MSRSRLTARGTIRTAISNEATGSARSHPVARITTAATIAASDPTVSLSTSRKAPRMFSEASRRAESTTSEIALASRPTAAKASIWPAATSGGSTRRRIPAYAR